MHDSPLLEIETIDIAFNGHSVFKGFSHTFELGCHAVRGPNGVGKSTLLGAVSGAVLLDQGTVRIAGHDLASDRVRARRSLAFVPDNGAFYPFMTGVEFVRFVLTTHGQQARFASSSYQSLLSDLDARPFLGTPLRDMSLGTRKKFFLMVALLLDPPVLVLDEPFNALDRTTAARLIGMLKERATERVVLLTSHQPSAIDLLGATHWYLHRAPHSLLLSQAP